MGRFSGGGASLWRILTNFFSSICLQQLYLDLTNEPGVRFFLKLLGETCFSEFF